MTTERKIIIGLVVAIVVGVAVMGRLAFEQHKALDTADTTVAANNATIEGLQKRMDARDSDVAQTIAKLTAAQNAVKTSPDAVRVINQIVRVPDTPANSTQAVAVQKSDLSSAVQAKLPDAPDYVVETGGFAQQTAKDLLACQSDRTQLQACTADKVDLGNMLATERNSTAAMTAAAKGGSTAKRFLKVAACVGMAGGGAAAGQLIGKQSRWAAVGAGAGVVGCQFVF